jgi:hypothetical protein
MIVMMMDERKKERKKERKEGRGEVSKKNIAI